MEIKGILNKYLKQLEDNSIIFTGNKLVIHIPEKFIENGITVINQTSLMTLGIFEAYIFDDVEEDDIAKAIHKFTLKLPSNIFMRPSHIDKVTKYVENIDTDTMEKENYFSFIFLNGDTFIVSTSVVQSTDTVDNFIYMLLNGQIPKSVNYDEIAKLWSDCAILNGSGNLKSDFNTLAMIISNVVRDPNNLSQPFRLVYDKYYEKGIMNGKMLRYMDIPRYISSFTAITGSDPRHGVTVAMERIHGENEKDIKSPVEEMIE